MIHVYYRARFVARFTSPAAALEWLHGVAGDYPYWRAALADFALLAAD